MTDSAGVVEEELSAGRGGQTEASRGPQASASVDTEVLDTSAHTESGQCRVPDEGSSVDGHKQDSVEGSQKLASPQQEGDDKLVAPQGVGADEKLAAPQGVWADEKLAAPQEGWDEKLAAPQQAENDKLAVPQAEADESDSGVEEVEISQSGPHLTQAEYEAAMATVS